MADIFLDECSRFNFQNRRNIRQESYVGVLICTLFGGPESIDTITTVGYDGLPFLHSQRCVCCLPVLICWAILNLEGRLNATSCEPPDARSRF